MIIVRAPLRIPIGGGGTDLPSYYSQFGGEWISAAINKYIYIIVNKRFDDSLRISYSKTEEVASPEQVQHPIVREALKLLGIKGGIEIVSIADVPSNTGLGTSGSFTVALLTALHAFLSNDIPPRKQIAEQACHIAMNLLKEPSGKQDEYIAAFGGITSFSANKNGEVAVTPLYPQIFSPEIVRKLENNLLMFYTGIRRESGPVLKTQAQAIDNLHQVRKIGQDIKIALAQNNFSEFGKLLDLHWQKKMERDGTSNSQINRWYEIAKKAGAIGGKLMGAGGGGFFIFYCEDKKEDLKKAMAAEGLRGEYFRFDFDGIKVIANFI